MALSDSLFFKPFSTASDVHLGKPSPPPDDKCVFVFDESEAERLVNFSASVEEEEAVLP